MISPVTLGILKIVLLGIIGALFIIKSVALSKYNRNSEEPAGFNIFGRFSSLEIDGSYSATRRKLLQYCNRLTNLIYFCIGLLALTYALPLIARQMGIS
jgi:hypothetical protein